MGGLILLFIIVLWVIAVKKLTTFLSGWIPAYKYSSMLKVLLFVFLLVMPFMDEIIGGFQFRALCKAEAVAAYDEAKVRGKTVKYKSREVIHYTNTILPTHKQVWIHIVDGSEKDSITIADLHSDGGWLSRWIDFNGVHQPYTFDGNCSGDKDGYLLHNLNIKRYINGFSGETM